MLKVVIDTSVFVAGLLSKIPSGSPSQTIQLWQRGAFILVMSPQIMEELITKLLDKGVDGNAIYDLILAIGKAALHIPGVYESIRLSDVDPGDNMFLAAAYESGADYIVSLDKKSLLPLKHFHGTQIRTPELFIRAVMGLPENTDPLPGRVGEPTPRLRLKKRSRRTR